MLGLLALGLTSLMIFTLVKNALLGTQLSSQDQFNGQIDLILPVSSQSDYYIKAWQNILSTYTLPSSFLRIHILIDGHHASLVTWTELKKNYPYLEIHNFPMRPTHLEATPWMIDQVSSKIEGQVIIIGDPELIPSQAAFHSIAKNVIEKDRSYFVAPQTAKMNIFGEANISLNPTLAFISYFGMARWRRYLTHSLASVAQGWMCMSLKNFKEIDFKTIRTQSWKEAILDYLEGRNSKLFLAFGEKLILRHYPENVHQQIQLMKEHWSELWNKKDKRGFWLYLITLFIWSFPVICLLTHPFWSLASFSLLLLYRFFSKIVFQESWTAILLHPLSCVAKIISLGWFVKEYFSSKRIKSLT